MKGWSWSDDKLHPGKIPDDDDDDDSSSVNPADFAHKTECPPPEKLAELAESIKPWTTNPTVLKQHFEIYKMLQRCIKRDE